MSGGDAMQVLVCATGAEELGMDIRDVREVVELGPFTRVPGAPPFVEGVINLRGKIIPVVHLGKRLGCAPGPPPPKARIVTVELDGAIVGVLVDRVSGIVRVPLARPPIPVLDLQVLFQQGERNSEP